MTKINERFKEILNKLEEEEKLRKDIILPFNKVKMNENGTLETIEGQILHFGEHSFTQFCNELQMPVRYMRRLLSEKPDFVAQQANYFLQKTDDDLHRRFRLIDNKILGIVSDKYVPYDDYELFGTIHNLLDRMPYAEVESFYRDDKRTQMKIRFPEYRRNVGVAVEDGNDDLLVGGITIQNSQVGYSSLNVLPLVWRMVCTNGMMGWAEGENGLRQRHIHFDPLTIEQQIEDGILVAADTTKTLMDNLEKSRNHKVENPIEEIEKHARRLNLTKKQTEKLKDVYFIEPQKNLYSVVNAFTRFARDVENNELQANLELYAGNILRMVA